MPWADLIDFDRSKLTDDEKRILLSVLQERRQSPQKRRSVAKKQAKKIKGEDVPDISKYI